jgi:hypothetical protein
MSQRAGRGFPSRRGRFGALLICAAVGSGAYLGSQSAQNAVPALPAAALAEFSKTVLPILSDNCVTCHNDQDFAGDLDMAPFRDPKVVAQRPDVWKKVLDMLSSGKMPPREMPPLAPGQAVAVMGWVERTYGLSAAHRDPATADPGRVTARRLNRTEYNNTVRDLLGVTLKPADEFPVDDSGYGFDNIGDVLTISPMLMEKYVRAARAVSQAAVFGESYPEKPTLIAKLQPKKDQDDLPATGTTLPFSVRGALYGTYRFPVDAEYEFRWRYGNYRGDEFPAGADTPAGAGRGAGGRGGAAGGRGAAAPQSVTPAAVPQVQGAPVVPADPAAPAGRAGGRGRIGGARPAPTAEELQAREEQMRTAAPPELMVFTVDGTKAYEFAVEGTTNYNYARGENIVRVKLAAGDHALRISWPRLANLPDPTAQYNRDGRRKLFVDYLDIHGPFSPSKEPPAGFKKIFICGAPGKYTPQCARQIVENMATRAYRRPATPQEVQRLLTLVNQVQKQDSFEEGVRVAIQAILMSPNFLFRAERDQPGAAVSATPSLALAAARNAAPPAADVPYRIGDYELASRLSYFLWSSMPDDALFEAARQKTLHERKVLDAQVKRMLADPKAVSLVENFGEQWLNLRLMDRKKPDALKFKAVDDELLDAMRQETRLFVGAVIKEDRNILDLIDGKFTFLNGPLARYYGIAGVDGEHFRRVELDGEQRSGLITQASILSISSYATRTSPVIRGKWVLDNLLGAAPPPPPDNIPALVEKDLGTAASMRQRLEQHRADPSCAACHNSMDPIGFSLENYDAAGGWRTKDGNFDIDSTGTLPDGRNLVGAKGLKQALLALSAGFSEHFADRLMTYALGRGLEKSDRPTLQQITGELSKNDYRFSILVSSIVNSRPFQMRSRATQ